MPGDGNGPGSQDDMASAIAVNPAGNAVYVTGASFGTATAYDYATVGYSAATGAQLWVERYNGPGKGFDEAHSVAVSPSGGAVYVTGYSTGTNGAHDYTTVAYNAATGATLWLKRYSAKSGGFSEARGVTISPDGSVVYVTGYSDGGQTTGYDYLTIAYRAATGATLWTRRWVGLVNVPLNNTDAAEGLALSPGGGTLYVTGQSAGTTSGEDYATVAYHG